MVLLFGNNNNGFLRTATKAAAMYGGGEEPPDNDCMVVLITGPYSGLGKETVKALLTVSKIKTIILAGRNRILLDNFVQELLVDDENEQDEKETDKDGNGNDDDDDGNNNNIRANNRLDSSHTVDLADLVSVQNFGKYVLSTYKQIDIWIGNAGIMNPQIPVMTTCQQHEIQVGVNCIGHFLLAKILVKITCRQIWISSYGHTLQNAPRIDIDAIRNFDPNVYPNSQVIVSASVSENSKNETHQQQHHQQDDDDKKNERNPEKDNEQQQQQQQTAEDDDGDDDGDSTCTTYDGWYWYQQSKLGNILLAKEFAKRYNDDLTAVSLHPGTIYTSLYRGTSLTSAIRIATSMVPAAIRGDIFQLIPKTVGMGAATTITCALMPDIIVNGGYYSNCTLVTKERTNATNTEDASSFFDYCDEITKQYQIT